MACVEIREAYLSKESTETTQIEGGVGGTAEGALRVHLVCREWGVATAGEERVEGRVGGGGRGRKGSSRRKQTESAKMEGVGSRDAKQRGSCALCDITTGRPKTHCWEMWPKNVAAQHKTARWAFYVMPLAALAVVSGC